VLGFDHPSILQSAAWGAFRERWGWRAVRLAWDDPPSAAQVLVKGLAPGGAFGYVPHGPLVAPETGGEAWAAVLSQLMDWARREGCAVLKLEPDVDLGRTDVRASLARAGFRPSHEAIQFPNTMCTDISVGPEHLWTALHQKTRYNVGLARKRGIQTRRAGEESLGTFFDLYAETAARDGFAIRERAYYLDIWSVFLRLGWATVILAERDGVPLAGVIPVRFGTTAFYMYGASATENRRDMPAYIAQWESLVWACEAGCDRYDWWGGPTAQDESDPLWGVARFKSGFGAQLRERVGPWDTGLKPGAAALYRALTGARRATLAWRTR
jgi:lipid II:glycine glycyltransferase (peptidoglycan interpeptide bridge formation enzyme)